MLIGGWVSVSSGPASFPFRDIWLPRAVSYKYRVLLFCDVSTSSFPLQLSEGLEQCTAAIDIPSERSSRGGVPFVVRCI